MICFNLDVYSDLVKLDRLCENKLDFYIGNFGKYRFGKLLSLEAAHTDRAIIMNSSEENVAIILKRITESYASDIMVPYKTLDIDFEHNITAEDLA